MTEKERAALRDEAVSALYEADDIALDSRVDGLLALILVELRHTNPITALLDEPQQETPELKPGFHNCTFENAGAGILVGGGGGGEWPSDDELRKTVPTQAGPTVDEDVSYLRDLATKLGVTAHERLNRIASRLEALVDREWRLNDAYGDETKLRMELEACLEAATAPAPVSAKELREVLPWVAHTEHRKVVAQLWNWLESREKR